MRFTKIPTETFKQIQINAGMLLKNFEPDTGKLNMEDILGATSGGVGFEAAPEFSDYGEDIDNCPKNMKELKVLDNVTAKMSGSFVTVSADLVKMLIGAATVETDKIIPKRDLSEEDFTDLWWVGDYSDDNTDENGGFVAIHLMNSLSTGGFKIQSNDKAKGTFDFEFTGHYSMAEQDKVPYEVFVKDEAAAGAALSSSLRQAVKKTEE